MVGCVNYCSLSVGLCTCRHSRRNAQGVLSLRELTGTLVIGQQHPMTRVLDPKVGGWD
jgi:hypothetical protein